MTDRTPVRRISVENALEDLKESSFQRGRALYLEVGEDCAERYREAVRVEHARTLAVLRLVDDYVQDRVDAALREAFGLADWQQLRAQGLL